MNLLRERIERRAPSVAGVISTREMLARATSFLSREICDVVEFRADLFGLDADWRPVAQTLQRMGIASFVTIRWSAEGGKYPADDSQRAELLKEAALATAGIDIEIQSKQSVALAEFCATHDRVCIASHHDFKGTPDAATLRRVVESAPEKATVVKVSCMAQNESDLEKLRGLLDAYPLRRLCIIAMGPIGTPTRISYAAGGSILTYGYLDDSAAPGQLPAATLVKELSTLVAGYREKR